MPRSPRRSKTRNPDLGKPYEFWRKKAILALVTPTPLADEELERMVDLGIIRQATMDRAIQIRDEMRVKMATK